MTVISAYFRSPDSTSLAHTLKSRPLFSTFDHKDPSESQMLISGRSFHSTRASYSNQIFSAIINTTLSSKG